MPLQLLQLRQLSMQCGVEGMAIPARPHPAPRLIQMLAVAEGAAATVTTMSLECIAVKCGQQP